MMAFDHDLARAWLAVIDFAVDGESVHWNRAALVPAAHDDKAVAVGHRPQYWRCPTDPAACAVGMIEVGNPDGAVAIPACTDLGARHVPVRYVAVSRNINAA